MRNRTLTHLPTLMALSLGCAPAAAPLDRASQAIVNGTLDTGDLAVVYLNLDNTYDCTGTLVSSRVVLTARHCLEGISRIDVFFGSRRDGPGDWIQAVDHLLHPQSGQVEDDVAILTMGRPAPTAPIPYFGGDLAAHVGEPLRIVGYGVTSENGMVSGIKRHGMSVLDSVDATTLSAGAVGSGTCYGDSGGPSLMTIDGIETLVGVTSYGTGPCGQPYDVSMRVDSYFDWITQYILQHDPSGAPDAGPVRFDAALPPDAGLGSLDGGLADSGDPDSGAPDAQESPHRQRRPRRRFAGPRRRRTGRGLRFGRGARRRRRPGHRDRRLGRDR